MTLAISQLPIFDFDRLAPAPICNRQSAIIAGAAPAHRCFAASSGNKLPAS